VVLNPGSHALQCVFDACDLKGEEKKRAKAKEKETRYAKTSWLLLSKSKTQTPSCYFSILCPTFAGAYLAKLTLSFLGVNLVLESTYIGNHLTQVAPKSDMSFCSFALGSQPLKILLDSFKITARLMIGGFRQFSKKGVFVKHPKQHSAMVTCHK